jgi:hypothetical protein
MNQGGPGINGAPPPPPPPQYRGPRDQGNFPGPSYNNNSNTYPNDSMDNYNQGPPASIPRPLITGSDPNYGPPQIHTNQVTIPNHLASCIIGPRAARK